MIFSMTGFGKASVSTPGKKITVEIKSLNSKQLDMSMRVPMSLREAELTLRGQISPRLERGKVELIAISETIGEEGAASINVEVMKAYKRQLEEMSEQLDIPKPEDWYGVLMRLPDALKADHTETDEADLEAFMRAGNEAVDALMESRRREGARLYDFFVEKIKRISSLLGEIDPCEAERVPRIRKRLDEQLERVQGIEYDKGRLEQELIFYIEKLDVSEEKLRLRSHLNYFLETLGEPDCVPQNGQGKKLGFIAQEMGREINTLGSKANHAEMQRIVVMMKDELEQIKEQVLNVL